MGKTVTDVSNLGSKVKGLALGYRDKFVVIPEVKEALDCDKMAELLVGKTVREGGKVIAKLVERLSKVSGAFTAVSVTNVLDEVCGVGKWRAPESFKKGATMATDLSDLEERIPIRKRKNLSNITEWLQEQIDKGVYEVGSIITAKMVYALIPDDLIEEWFDRDEARVDDHGPTRSIGDLIGAHGLNLRKADNSTKCKKYVIPSKLPVVENDCLYEEAVY